MFGFLSPALRDRNFCRAYTRLCQSQMKEYGAWLLPFHSYESTHLYLIASDAGIVSLDAIPSRACCQFERYTAPVAAVALETERFCSSFSTLLGYIDLKDAVHDGVAIFQRVLLLAFHRRFEQCMHYFSRLDPEFVNVISRIIDGQNLIEQRTGTLTIDQFVAATGNGFAYLFALFARVMGRPDLTATLESIGRHVGEAVCGFDVAHDFFDDQRSGAANPLESEAQIPQALARAKASLTAAAQICREQFGDDSLASAHLLSVEKTLVLAQPNKVVKLAGQLAGDVASPCAAKNAAFLSFPFAALADKECGEVFCISGLMGLLGTMTCVNRAAGACGCNRNVTILDPQTGLPTTGQEECRHRLM
jgi:hypothetical protein